MAKMKCGDVRNGIKTCRVNGVTFKLHTKATAKTKARRAAWARKWSKVRFTPSSRFVCERNRKGQFTAACRTKGNMSERINKAMRAAG